MRVVAPRPFLFEGGDRAVLLLHGFTGTTADVRMLGRHLQKRGYTCHAPLYKGHGVPPEELVQTGPVDWWKDVERGYEFLKARGYTEIAVAGLSLGGVFSLKIGYTFTIKGIVSMCAPMRVKTEEAMYRGVRSYAQEFKKLERKSAEQIQVEMKLLEEASMDMVTELSGLIEQMKDRLNLIHSPIYIVQARHDEVIDVESANMIYNDVESVDKSVKWYEESSHVITLGKEKEQLHDDVYQFLERLDWSE